MKREERAQKKKNVKGKDTSGREKKERNACVRERMVKWKKRFCACV